MSGSRNKNAWVWVAIAAIAFASSARAEAGLHSAKAYAHPVLEFLAKSQIQNPAAKPGVSRFAQLGSRHPLKAMSRDAGIGMCVAILPVFFIGLVSPLNLLSAASVRGLYQVPAAPLLPALFQRPPPLFI
ncbi:MAG TPA: hypothetical protein VGI45_08255 [Terracidiphilus sp.]|jgi:hypothetical protein